MREPETFAEMTRPEQDGRGIAGRTNGSAH